MDEPALRVSAPLAVTVDDPKRRSVPASPLDQGVGLGRSEWNLHVVLESDLERRELDVGVPCAAEVGHVDRQDVLELAVRDDALSDVGALCREVAALIERDPQPLHSIELGVADQGEIDVEVGCKGGSALRAESTSTSPSLSTSIANTNSAKSAAVEIACSLEKVPR